MLETFSAPGQFWRGNLHGHSTGSDGMLSPADVCAAYRTRGYDFIAVTDHFRKNFGYPITDTRAHRQNGLATILGAELHAPVTSRGIEWHLLAVGLPLDFAVPGADETGPQLAERARAGGAFVAIAHPHWYQLTAADGHAVSAAHAVEIYNHHCQVSMDRGLSEYFYDALLSDGRRLNAIAVDDSHWRMADAFGGWVMVKAEANTEAGLLAALKAGHFYSSQGPEIADVRREDNHLVVTCSPASSLILLGEGRQRAAAYGDGLCEARLSLDPFGGSWCRLVIVDEAGRRAWSNPLWLD